MESGLEALQDSAHSEFLARMLELKQKFMEAKKQTEAKPTSPPTNVPSPQANQNSPPLPIQNQFQNKKRPAPNDAFDQRRRKKRKVVESERVQELLKQIIEEHGGSCHLETIVEYVRRQAQVTDLFPPEERADVKEIKKQVKYLLQNLQDSMNTLIFTQDSYKDGCWLINPDVKKFSESDSSNPLMTTETLTGPLSDGDYSVRKYIAPAYQGHSPRAGSIDDVLTNALEKNDGTAHIDVINDYVFKNWDHKLSNGKLMTDEQLKERIRTTLDTHPKFMRDPISDNKYILTNRKKRRGSYNTNGNNGNNNSNGNRRGAPGRKKKYDSDGEDSVRSKRTSTNSLSSLSNYNPHIKKDPPAPSEGYQCSCGRAYSSQEVLKTGAIWYYGPHPGTWMCAPCGSRWSKEHACPVCGRVYDSHHLDLDKDEDDEDEEDEDDEDEDEDEDEEGEWIQCDQCSRWVMCKCDGINDLSIYDDSNPNHLPYLCPMCRNEQAEKPLVFHTRQQFMVWVKTNTRNRRMLRHSGVATATQTTSTVTTTTRVKPEDESELKRRRKSGTGSVTQSTTTVTTQTNVTVTPQPATHAHTLGVTSRVQTVVHQQLNDVNMETEMSRPLLHTRLLDKLPHTDCKITLIERELLRGVDQQREESDERWTKSKFEKTSVVERKFVEEISRIREYLVQTRNSLWDRSQKDLERQIDKLKKEKKMIDEKIEGQLIDQFRVYFQKKLDNFNAQMDNILNNSDDVDTSA
jgi:hypothetical protein